MKKLNHWVFVLGFVLAGHAQAAEVGAPTNYTGAVVDDKGRPVAGATVDCYHYPDSRWYGALGREPELTQHTVTDSKGGFAISNSPGTTLAVVKKASLATAWKTWSFLDDDSPEPLVLSAPAALSGLVVDESKQPVADAQVWVSYATIENNDYSRGAQENRLFGRAARECFSVRTGADGRFRIENFPADGRASLAVKKEGKAQRPIGSNYVSSLDCRGGEEDIELRVGPAGAVEGKVTVTETGQPVGGVKVRLQGTGGGTYGTESREPIESREDGTFRIPDVQPGKYYVMGALFSQPLPDWVLAPDYKEFAVVAGETNRDAAVHLSKGVLVEVTVVVTNELKPLADALVTAGDSTAFTDTNGTAVLRVQPDTNWFTVSRRGWSPQNSEAKIEAGRTNKVRLMMIPPPRITGIVSDSSGAPVAGAIVSFHPGHYPAAPEYVEVTTDKNGRYEMAIKEDSRGMVEWDGPISLINHVMARSVGRNLAAIREFEVFPTNLDFTLKPGITLSGSVKDTEGAPVISATVELYIMGSNSSFVFNPRPARVDAQGSFVFPAMPQGRQYLLEDITAKGYGTADGSLPEAAARTNHYEFPAFVLKRADRKVEGQVLGPDGKPLAGASVTMYGQGQPQSLSARSNSKGHFVVNGVCEGAVQFSAFWSGPSDDGGAPNTMFSAGGAGSQAQAGDTNVVIQLRAPNVAPNAGRGRAPTAPPVTTTGTVYDPSGAPVAGVKLEIHRSGRGGIANVTTNTDADGKYSMQWPPPAAGGSADVIPTIVSVLTARDPARNLAAAQYLYATNTSADVRLSEGLSLSGSVKDAGGKPMDRCNVRLTLIDANYTFTLDNGVTDADGSFSFKGLPHEDGYGVYVSAGRAGGYGVGGQAGSYGVAQRTLAAVDARTNHYTFADFVLKKADRKLGGYVLDANTKLMAGAVVSFSGEGQPSRPSMTTDEKGHFEFDGVCEGTVKVYVRTPVPAGGGVAVTLNGGRGQEARGGDTNLVLKLGDTQPDGEAR